MSLLTGHIRLAGIDWGYASRTRAVRAQWVDESIYLRYDDGHEELDEPRWYLEGEFGFDMLSGVELAELKGLTDEPFALILRTWRDGDPSWPELEVLVRRTSPIEETGPMYLKDAFDGSPVYSAQIAFRSTHAVSSIPGAIEGGWTVIDTGTTETIDGIEYPIYEMEAWGEATATLMTMDVPDGAGGTIELQYYELGPPELADLLIQQHPDDPYAVIIDNTGTLRLGTSIQTS